MFKNIIKTTELETPVGDMIAAATKDGICLLSFKGNPLMDKELGELASYFGIDVKHGTNRHLRALKKQLKEYFKGKRKEFSLPLLTPGTEFQQLVWNSLRKIPYGTTMSYLRQAKILKNPAAVRAVAGANGANRIAIVIPCHRVIGSGGDLVGYGGGIERKRWLIEHERKNSGQPVEGSLF
jgi:AraC family transcriptional regulator of adaptative response/methylated-DNA-[protein]-cysteine methyltransferase